MRASRFPTAMTPAVVTGPPPPNALSFGQIGLGEVSHVLTETPLDVGALLKAVFERLACSSLQSGTLHCLRESVHLRGELLIRRQGDLVDVVLDVRQGLTVESRDLASKAVDEVFELVVRNGAVDVPVTLGEIAVEILTPEQDLEGSAPSDETGQPRGWAASRNSAEADFRLTDHRPLSTCEADVGRENQLAARSASSPADR